MIQKKSWSVNKMQEIIKDISRRRSLSHLGSCFTSLPIINEIYGLKKDTELCIISCGHAHLAHAVVMESYGVIESAEDTIIKNGIHCDIKSGCDCSTGSLGQGLPIALGMAMADRSRNVYCLISDGESSEGTIWEVANVMHKYYVYNLIIYCNWNGWGAYDKIGEGFIDRLEYIVPHIKMIKTSVTDHGFTGQEAHYIQAK